MAEHITPSVSSRQNTGIYDVRTAFHDAEARMDMYRFLSTIYLQPPSDELIKHFADIDTVKQLESMFGANIISPLHNMALAFDSPNDITELKQEYMGLFSVPTGQYVTPFEDVYRGLRLDGNQERGPLLGDRAVEVKVIYRSAGANIEKTCKELPTHVGVELSFMNFLCEQEALRLEQDKTEFDVMAEASIYRQWQLKFLHDHLADWFPQLRKSIKSKARLPFYTQMAQLTQSFLDQDKDWLIQKLKSDLELNKAVISG